MSISGDFVTTAEAAKMLRVSKIRVLQFFHAGRLSAERVGTNLVFDRDSVKEFSKQRRPNGRPKSSKKNR